MYSYSYSYIYIESTWQNITTQGIKYWQIVPDLYKSDHIANLCLC